MCRVSWIALYAVFATTAIAQANAQSLRVSPVTIDLPVSASSATLTVANDAQQPITLQARVFRWSQKDGQDVLEKTSDVVVSPPLVKVEKGAEGAVRVVRVASSPIRGEESYRILLDEVPSREKLQTSGVHVVIRQSMPVFFSGFDATASAVNWRVNRHGDRLILQASNSGQKRLRVSQLRLIDAQAKEVAKIDGLAGYVLGGQSRAWELKLPEHGVPAGTSVSIEATTETGPINAAAIVGNSG